MAAHYNDTLIFPVNYTFFLFCITETITIAPLSAMHSGSCILLWRCALVSVIPLAAKLWLFSYSDHGWITLRIGAAPKSIQWRSSKAVINAMPLTYTHLLLSCLGSMSSEIFRLPRIIWLIRRRNCQNTTVSWAL